MPYLRDYHILISHSWSYSNYYNTIASWLNDTNYFKWSDYSVSCDKPLNTDNDYQLKEKLTSRISNSSVVIVISGMYSAYSKWIDYEIDEAKRLGKPIIGVKPWGQERIPLKIQNNSTTMVGWNRDSIINAVRIYAI